jgi:hypothetical protein
MLVFNKYFYKNKKSKLYFGDSVAVLNDFIYQTGGSKSTWIFVHVIFVHVAREGQALRRKHVIKRRQAQICRLTPNRVRPSFQAHHFSTRIHVHHLKSHNINIYKKLKHEENDKKTTLYN